MAQSNVSPEECADGRWLEREMASMCLMLDCVFLYLTIYLAGIMQYKCRAFVQLTRNYADGTNV